MEYNIVFATDKNYVEHLGVALLSLLENNSNLLFNVYILNEGIDQEKYQKLLVIASKFNCNLVNVFIDDSCFDDITLNHHFSKANYYRLLIPDLITKDKVLYLDSDIIVDGSIVDLYSTPVDDFFVAAVENPGFDRHKELFMNNESKYFNSGVMVINCVKWKAENLKSKVVKFVHDYGANVEFADQCGLNSIINGNWKNISLVYNQQAIIFEDKFEKDMNCFSPQELMVAKEKPVIIHYTGSSKPWHLENRHPFKNKYTNYLKKTPFCNVKYRGLSASSVIKRIVPHKLLKTLISAKKKFFKK